METWGFKSKWLAKSSMVGRKAVYHTCQRNLVEMSTTMSRAFQYALPETVKEFQQWERQLLGRNRQSCFTPCTARDKVPGLLAAKIKNNDDVDRQLVEMGLPSLKPSVRGELMVPPGLEDGYHGAIIHLEELKELGYCMMEMQTLYAKMKDNYKIVNNDLAARATWVRSQPREVKDYNVHIMRSNGKASRLNESISIDDPWPEGE